MTVFEYAKENASLLFREPAGQLRCPFIVPGATYRFELWDWDCWLTDVALCQVLEESGQLHEYYDPDTCAPVYNPGFQSWNLLAANMEVWLKGGTPVTEF